MGTFPQWLVTGLLAMTVTLGGMVWKQQRRDIEDLKAGQKQVADDQINRMRIIATLEANDRLHDMAIGEIKLGVREIVGEVKEMNRLIRDRKL